MNFQSINAAASPETQMNENFDSINFASVYGQRHTATSGLTFGYWGGVWSGFTVANGTLSFTGGSPTTLNYIVADRTTGAISTSTATTNWLNTSRYARVGIATCSGSAIDSFEDHRAGLHGTHGDTGGGVLWNDQTNDYTLVAADMLGNGGVAMNKATANTLTVPTNASVPVAVGKSVLVYQKGVGKTSIVGSGGVTIRAYTGASPQENAIIGQYGVASLIKYGSDEWILMGAII